MERFISITDCLTLCNHTGFVTWQPNNWLVCNYHLDARQRFFYQSINDTPSDLLFPTFLFWLYQIVIVFYPQQIISDRLQQCSCLLKLQFCFLSHQTFGKKVHQSNILFPNCTEYVPKVNISYFLQNQQVPGLSNRVNLEHFMARKDENLRSTEVLKIRAFNRF